MLENPEPAPEESTYYYVYILRCSDKSTYTGCTSNLKERLNRHQKGYVESTKVLTPVKLIWSCAFTEQSRAFAFEKYLKSGSGRAFAKKHLLSAEV
ncbi:MAG: GIY-YIG nuclease family protein [Lewinellaceae bacterium]|nr:GIY-YIG nuclease family protein [Lewinellaceae bacterium]